jgi:coenzyme F420-reducing hydrogenase gamma subunit
MSLPILPDKIAHQKRKPVVAIKSLTGCAGCQLTIYFIKDQLLNFATAFDIVDASMIGLKKDGPYDICIVEGMVAKQEDLDQLKQWREESTLMVAWGTCATHANVQGMKQMLENGFAEKEAYGTKRPKNLVGKNKSLEPTPIKAHVKINYEISGCPPEEVEFLKMMKQLLLGLNPTIYQEPVCVECTQREIHCLLEQGRACLGPLTRGGCDALCPGVNHSCTGCHGPVEIANIPQAVKLLQDKGLSLKQVKQALAKYATHEYIAMGMNLDEKSKKVMENRQKEFESLMA